MAQPYWILSKLLFYFIIMDLFLILSLFIDWIFFLTILNDSFLILWLLFIDLFFIFLGYFLEILLIFNDILLKLFYLSKIAFLILLIYLKDRDIFKIELINYIMDFVFFLLLILFFFSFFMFIFSISFY